MEIPMKSSWIIQRKIRKIIWNNCKLSETREVEGNHRREFKKIATGHREQYKLLQEGAPFPAGRAPIRKKTVFVSESWACRRNDVFRGWLYVGQAGDGVDVPSSWEEDLSESDLIN
jgi:hypothetical protein